MRILFLVPHCDDEVLLGGGSISKHIRNGDIVDLCVLFSVPDDIRQKNQILNCEKVVELLKINNFFKLGLDDKTLSNDILTTAQTIELFLKDKEYDILYTVSPYDNHQHHRTLSKAINIATRIIGPNPIKKILCGETISSTDQTFKTLGVFNPNYYNILLEQDVESKIKALQLYHSEVRSYPHPRSPEIIKSYAMLRGSECMSNFAEAFIVLRCINE